MSQLGTVDAQEIIARAGEALFKASGGTVVLDELEVLSNDNRRNFIAQAAARYSGGSARSVIVKRHVRRVQSRGRERAPGLGLGEGVGRLLLPCRTRPAGGHGSALLAGDVSGSIMVFEDLGAHLISLVEPLLKGTAQEAERALKLYATALGRLHADTVGCLDAHHERCRTGGAQAPRHSAPERAGASVVATQRSRSLVDAHSRRSVSGQFAAGGRDGPSGRAAEGCSGMPKQSSR
jgi:hypothetical protein